ncbi:MAG: GH3 auxin-responsive promoter family protein [Thaumarchaeota archaeon]|nr:GH3 auxin-responsive promoter family protein [Nitrososphaerota archaeon]
MGEPDPDLSPFLKEFVDPWYRSLENPAESQKETLLNLLVGYAKTDYGKEFGADRIESLSDFQKLLPVVDYSALLPYLERVKKGDYSALLPEPVSRWVMTRGTTGNPKLIPTTESHLSLILAVGARAIINFALRRDPKVLEMNVLNLNFPSEVGSLLTDKGQESYGYSSGSYAKLNPSLGPTSLVPKQEEIDKLGGGIEKTDWERRFELVYQSAKDSPVGSVMGVTPVITGFAKYLSRRHGVLPKELWKMRGLFCTSVAKIQTSYAPMLRHQYGGSVPLVEMYTATEGVFAQQIDQLPYVCPNYDTFVFEVKTSGAKIKLLHEMQPHEWGRIIISGPLFPRYDIGDMVESVGKNRFRIFGRANMTTYLEHAVFEVVTGGFHF